MAHLDDPGSFLISEGFRAHRFRGVVYVIRRALWPFVRSFFLATVALVREVDQRATSRAQALEAAAKSQIQALEARLVSLEAAAGSQIQTLEAVLQAMEARHASIEAATQVHLQAQEARLQSLEAGHASTLSELHKFVRPIVEFKTESAAIYNRYLILERLVREGVVSQANFSSQLEFANSRLNAYQVALDAKFADFATAWRDELAVETVRLNESISLTSKNINSTFERLDATNSILEQQKDILAHSITSLSEQISVNNSSARDIRSDFGDEIQLIRSELDRISTELGESLNSSSTSVESLKSALVEVNSQVVHGLAEKEDKISEMGGRLERLDESLLALKSEAGGQADPSDANPSYSR